MTKPMPTNLSEVEGRVANHAEGTREEYCYYYLRELTCHTASESHLSRMAGRILAKTGL